MELIEKKIKKVVLTEEEFSELTKVERLLQETTNICNRIDCEKKECVCEECPLFKMSRLITQSYIELHNMLANSEREE